MNFLMKQADQFFNWFHGLNTQIKSISFFAAVFGWLPFMFGTSFTIWVVGYVWLSASIIFLLSLYLRA